MKVNYEKEEKWEAFLGIEKVQRRWKRKCPDLQVETSLLEDWQLTKRRKVSLESLYGGRKDFILEPRSDIQHCSEWETILKGWKSGAQLVIEFQNQEMATLEYIPWEGGKRTLLAKSTPNYPQPLITPRLAAGLQKVAQPNHGSWRREMFTIEKIQKH